MSMLKLARILTEKQSIYHNINYHHHMPSQTKCVPVSIRIPEPFYNEIDSSIEIKPIPVGTKDSFILALLYLFASGRHCSDWLTKYMNAYKIKHYLISKCTGSGLVSDLERGRLLHQSTIKTIAECLDINILLVKTRSVQYLTCSNPTAITVVILESDREIYYPLAVDGILVHSMTTSRFLENFRSEKMK